MRTIRTKIYKFEELNEEAKNNAIEKERNSEYNVNLDFFKEYAKEQIEASGFFNDVSLQYSLSFSQGDGLSFSCKNIESKVLLQFFSEVLGEGKEKTAKVIIENCSFENTGNKGTHYCYSSRNDVSYEFDDYSGNKLRIHDLVGKVETKIKDLYINLCEKLENQGYKEIEYQQSDKYISENLISNEYEFTKDGNIF